MNISTIPVGPGATNCYIIEEDDSSFIIDPGDEAGKIYKYIQDKNIRISNIILTHGHFDHIGAVSFLRNKLDVMVFIHQLDNPYLLDPNKNLSYMLGDDIVLEPAERFLVDEEIYNSFQVIATPGHTPGGISLYNKEEGILFSGDTIFHNGYGRTDFPGADHQTLFDSIKILLELPADTVVYPGHGPTTTIKEFERYIG